MALMLFDQAQAWQLPHRCVVAAAADGDNPNVLAGLEARQEQSIVGVRTDFQVSLGSMVTRPVWRADALLQTVPRWQWRTIRWQHGSKGWLRKKSVPLRSSALPLYSLCLPGHAAASRSIPSTSLFMGRISTSAPMCSSQRRL